MPQDPRDLSAPARDGVVSLAQRLRLLGDVSELLSAGLDQGIGVRRLAELVVPQLADWCIVTVRGTRGLHRDLGWAHRDPASVDALGEYARQQYANMSPEAAVSVCLRTGRPVIVREMPPQLLDGWVRAGLARENLGALVPGSVAVLPLAAGGQTFGAMALVTLASRGPQTPEELDIAAEVARRAGLALDNARLYGLQRDLASALQRSMLTAAPRLEGLEVALRYVPAALEAQVGGDWYDTFEQPDGRSVLVIGDVVGHDSDAAAAMGQVRGLLRGIGYTTGAAPAALLRRLDEAIAGLHVDTTATALVATVERDADGIGTGTGVGVGVGAGAETGAGRTLRWSNAGHPPLALIDPAGEPLLLLAEPSDLLLGVEPTTDRHERTLALQAGSTLVLYTDGLVERRGMSLDDGLERLRTELRALAAEDLDVLCDELLARMLTDRPEDDVCLLAVRAPDVATG